MSSQFKCIFTQLVLLIVWTVILFLSWNTFVQPSNLRMKSVERLDDIAERHMSNVLQSSVPRELDIEYKMAEIRQGRFGSPPAPPIINPHPYTYLIQPTNICAKNLVLDLLIYIHSAADYFQKRAVIRQTWGNVTHYAPRFRVQLVFILGKPTNASTQRQIEAESGKYKDIVQENFEDTYSNNIIKAVTGLKWVANNCRHANFVLKSDDDMVVDLPRWLDLLQKDYPGLHRGLLLCNYWVGRWVFRKGRWKVEKSEWPFTQWPPFCQGSAFTMTPDVVVNLHAMSYYVRTVRVDDVYITGILPLQLSKYITHVNYSQFYADSFTKNCSGECPECIFHHCNHSGGISLRNDHKVLLMNKSSLLWFWLQYFLCLIVFAMLLPIIFYIFLKNVS